MKLNHHVFDIWVFRRGAKGVDVLLLYTSQLKADRHFNGGRFWQIPCGVLAEDEHILAGIDREVVKYGLEAKAIFQAECVYTIYNRRFDEIEIISVFAAEVDGFETEVTLDAEEHERFAWVPYEEAMEYVHYRGLKDGLRSTHEYITGVDRPARELQLR